MARRVKPEEYAARRGEILDVALQLMHDKGYEKMTIDDVLTKLQMSKGALYHYFGSKQALLEGIVDALAESASRPLRAVVDDAGLGAIDKLNAYMNASATWKADNPTAVATLVHLWRDENALFRQKLAQESMRTSVPMLEAIIRQGCDEGVFDTAFPHEAAMFIAGLDGVLADAYAVAIEQDGRSGIDIGGPRAQRVLGAYLQAFERILGMTPGSLTVSG
ncbi:TetR/AcrR family transcriptional regulator [Mycolicibacterium wolinskyi]|uniref:TetR/AcrR family transcriptional regulator n=1 Tax=Mycolicibacterium TaxID=1866885 RepID=UPI00105598E3|nr:MULTISPECIES: TetR/AcrR family transcriptional regulator [Mycolicibacterium]MCV7289717.1 TetR/AcrR family transcriptional regulator [Mycolicibacterium wolinskyi]MCV7296688.1 TetR/AcrR family transcriptional regulator [Mycolicibacterium goodii]